ncbi:MAG: DNA topoisomerase [Lachnospiraceae bacterium]|nr:DNA topoisomerase [Lachnospiraceae bacterium]
MGKYLYIAEKPSVAQEFAKALKEETSRRDGYLEGAKSIVTWCVGHLITMSYPEKYDPALKRWQLSTIPFLPREFRYEVIPSVKKQFEIVKGLLNREDVERIYVCTDSGREGEYIYRLVDQMAQVPKDKDRRRVWIDSQTEEEILRGIREAKPLSAYDALSDAAYLRAKEDYLMGINFSRALTLKYGATVQNALHSEKRSAIAVGRVMTCVLGMVVRREREIRAFVKTPFYRVIGTFLAGEQEIAGEWRAVEGSAYYRSPLLYKENGFRREEDAKKLISELEDALSETERAATIEKLEKKKEKKNPPLLFNLAELQNECSRSFKISPDETLQIAQELYEKKLVTYPRTDARVLSSAVAKEITKNLGGLATQEAYLPYVREIKASGSYASIGKSRYTDDKQITDHYAIIPTGQGFGALSSVSPTGQKVYDRIVRRFLSVFYPAAEYQKVAIVLRVGSERFFASFKVLEKPGYLAVAGQAESRPEEEKKDGDKGEKETLLDEGGFAAVKALKKGMTLPVREFAVKEGETSPPKRYNSGTLILAMENAGQLIEDEELRAQIKGSGIGTSATRAEILNKLVKIGYLNLNKKTQIVTPAKQGEMVYEVVASSVRSLLNAELTASWEKGLTYVAEGTITEEEYMQKLEAFVAKHTNGVKDSRNEGYLREAFQKLEEFYRK